MLADRQHQIHLTEQKGREFAFCLTWDIRLLLSAIATPGSQAFGLGRKLIPFPPRPFSSLWVWTGTTSLALLALQLADGRQVVGFLSLHNCISQTLIINLILYSYIYPTGSVSLENSD